MTPVEPAVLALAILLDVSLVDPRWLLHPVVVIGRLITFLESFLRKTVPHERTAGILLLFFTIFGTAAVTWLLLFVSAMIHSLVAFAVAAVMACTCLAARSLHHESALVAAALAAGDLTKARQQLGTIVGRDTAELGEPEIWRALIETVAENTSDGIIAPLFWLTLGGPVMGMTYKAVSTLDSMVGYRNDRYLHVGWASARMDDLLNFIPARLTALLMILAAPLAGLSAAGALNVTRRDRHNYPSPNSGHPEAAAAGALGVRLGGAATYGGRESWKEYIGDPTTPLDAKSYRGMISLMYLTTLLMSALCICFGIALRGFHVPHL